MTSKKRVAESDLNHDNWNDEEKSEVAGVFTPASEEELSGRRIIKAKRRSAGGITSDNIFSTFKGFSNTPTIQPSPGTFDFIKSINKPLQPQSTVEQSVMNTSNASEKPITSASTVTSQFNGPSSTPSTFTSTTPSLNVPSLNSNKTITSISTFVSDKKETKISNLNMEQKKIDESEPKSKKKKCDGETINLETEANKRFLEKITILNMKFANFIQTSLAKNPLVILSPPFEDYKKYVDQFLKEKLEEENKVKLQKQNGFDFNNLPPINKSGKITLTNDKSKESKTYTIGNVTTENNSKTPESNSKNENKPNFEFGSNNETSSTNKPNFIFGILKTTDNKTNTNVTKTNFNSNKLVEINTSIGLNNAKKESENTAKSFSFVPTSISKVETKTEEVKTFSFTPTSKTTDSSKGNDTLSKPNFSFGLPSSADTKTMFGGSFGNNKESNKNEEKTNAAKPTFSFTKTDDTFRPSFGFGLSTPKTDTSTFSFGTKFSSGSLPAPSFGTMNPFSSNAPSSETAGGDGDDEVLPKEEVKEVIEEDSIFNVKCKVLITKPDKTFADRGVGNLFVKSLEEGAKAQLIVRAGTDTGKIIFNVVINKSVPVEIRNNFVIFICVPHPCTEKNPEPRSCYVKVKTADDAKKLYDCVQKFRG